MHKQLRGMLLGWDNLGAGITNANLYDRSHEQMQVCFRVKVNIYDCEIEGNL